MKKVRKAAIAVGVAGALSVGALVAVPALAGSDGAPADSPARYGQVVDDDDELARNPNCTGAQERERDRDQLRIYMQDRDCDGAQLRHQRGRGNGPVPGAGNGECPFAAAD